MLDINMQYNTEVVSVVDKRGVLEMHANTRSSLTTCDWITKNKCQVYTEPILNRRIKC